MTEVEVWNFISVGLIVTVILFLGFLVLGPGQKKWAAEEKRKEDEEQRRKEKEAKYFAKTVPADAITRDGISLWTENNAFCVYSKQTRGIRFPIECIEKFTRENENQTVLNIIVNNKTEKLIFWDFVYDMLLRPFPEKEGVVVDEIRRQNLMPSPTQQMDTLDTIKKLHDLMEQGIISQAEFDQKKINLLNKL